MKSQIARNGRALNGNARLQTSLGNTAGARGCVWPRRSSNCNDPHPLVVDESTAGLDLHALFGLRSTPLASFERQDNDADNPFMEETERLVRYRLCVSEEEH
nr:hypothetical protein BDOA9_0203710 [Bradyrhizobium sp. DOA9]